MMAFIGSSGIMTALPMPHLTVLALIPARRNRSLFRRAEINSEMRRW
jgi:hypothetical protein